MKIRISLVLIACIGLASCTTKFVYKHLDWALEWYIDDLVTLNEDQEWLVHDAVDSILEWHRRNQLPFYIESLTEVEEAIKSEITVEFLKRFYFAHEKGWMELKYRATPTLTGLLKTLSDHQVKELKENMEEQENELREKYLDVTRKSIVEVRKERAIDRIEDWVGNLNEEQKQTVLVWSQEVKTVVNEWIESRQQWQSNLVRIVRESRNKPDFNELMMEHFQNSRKYWPPGYREDYYQNVNATLEMIAKLGRQLSPQQKQEFLENVTEFKNQLIEIYNDK